MDNIQMLMYKTNKLYYENNSKIDKIEIGSNYQSKVEYDEINHKCLCTYNVKIFDKDNAKQFNIEVEIIGVFSYPENESKENVHVAVTHELFSNLRSAVISLTAMAGITPILIRPNNITVNDVKDQILNGQN